MRFTIYLMFYSVVDKYLQEVHTQNLAGSHGVATIPTGAHVADDEQVKVHLLFLLVIWFNVLEHQYALLVLTGSWTDDCYQALGFQNFCCKDS